MLSLNRAWTATLLVFVLVTLIGSLVGLGNNGPVREFEGVFAQSSGSSLTYLDDGDNAAIGGQRRALVDDIRGSGTISTVTGGVKYTSNSGERSEHYIGSHTKPLWSDSSSGWFAFDFTMHDTDSSWRLIEQEHEGDMSPSRALEASQSIKLVARSGTPHTRGPDKTWTATRVNPGQRIQIVGYEKFGQGGAIMQAWWRPYGQSNWTQFANDNGFSMGYTSGNPGRYHKRGTYHGNHGESSSVTWYGTAVMHADRSSAEAAAGISGGAETPTPSPTPTPTPTPDPAPTPQPPVDQSPSGDGVVVEGGDATQCTTLGKVVNCKSLAQMDSLAPNGYGLQLNHQNDSVSHTFQISDAGKYRIGAYLKSQNYRGNAKMDMYVDGNRVNNKSYEVKFVDKYNYYYIERMLSPGAHSIKVVYVNDKCGNTILPSEKCIPNETDRDLWVDRLRIISL